MRKFLLLMIGNFLCCLIVFGQSKTITGKVTDENGKSLEGVSLLNKANNRGTITDASGNFTITASEGNKLVISAVGYSKKEVTVGDGREISIVITASTAELDEVVVTALGIPKAKKALGYAVSTVDKKDLEQRPEGDVVRILDGKAPGVNIINTSGLSGSGTNINIRGISTITGSSQPLFIVDGVAFNSNTNAQADFTYGTQTSSRFLDLDPNDIQNISILKGLSATTLYGEQGRNGVILITTKNGSTQNVRKKSEITVSQSVFGSQAILPSYNDEYGGGFDLSLGIAYFSNWGAKFTNPPVQVTHPYDKPALAAAFPQFQGVPYDYKFYNSVPNFFRSGLTTNTSVNAAGSSGALNYNMNYSYTDDQGYLIGNGLIKNNFGIGGTAKLSNKFTVGATFNYVITDVKSPPTSNSYGNNPTNTSVFGNVLYTPTAVDLMGLPYENPLDHSSIYYRNGNDIQNPRWTLYNSFTDDNVNRFFGQVNVNYQLLNSLSLSYRVGLDNYSEFQEYAQNKGGISTPTGIYRTSTGTSTLWDHNFTLNYDKKFNADWSLSAVAGAEEKRTSYFQTGQTSTQQLVYGILNHSNFISHDVYSENGSALNYSTEVLNIGAFAQGILGYKDYAYLSLGGRNSWESTVETNNRSIFYPSASISFLPTAAFDGLKGNKTVNYLKLRFGYSTSANFPDPYSTRAYLNVATKQFLTNSGNAVNINSIPNLLPNPDLKPELIEEYETGLEGTFFDKRVTVDLTFYDRNAKNQILYRDLDPSTGYTQIQTNAGSVSNKGIELALGYSVIRNKNWTWHLDGLYTLNKSLVSNIPSDIKYINTAGYTNEGTIAENGLPLGVILGTYFEKSPKGGNQRVVDQTIGDYITAGDVGVIGDPNPHYKVTGISTLSYRSITFRMQWEYTCGGDIYSGTIGALLGRGVTKDTKFDRALPVILPGVDANGNKNEFQISATQAYYDNSITNGAADESAIYDATLIRLREASISYSLPQKLISRLPFGSISISASGTNLWYFAPNFPKYVHFDPESSGLGVSNGHGLEFLSGPSARRFGGSIRITF